MLENNLIKYKKYIDYLQSNKFTNHNRGNCGMYGLHFENSNSIIKFNNDLWIFIYWTPNSNIANYINTEGEIFSFDPYHKDLDITRMMEHN